MKYAYPDPFYSPFTAPSVEERRSLSRAAGFIGVLMLLLTVTMQITYPLVALVLSFCNVLPANALMLDELGVGNTKFLCVYACVYTLAMGFPLLLTLGYRRLFAARYPKRDIAGGCTFLSIVTAVGGCMAANIVTSLFMSFLEQWGVPIPEMPDMMEQTPTSLLLNLFIIAVLPALLEEAVFRGCVLRVLRPFGDGFAVCISAILFGLMHGNIRQVPFAIIVGLVLGKLYVSTNSIWFPVLVHFINNALSVWMEYLAVGMSDEGLSVFYGGIIYGLTVVGAIAGIVLLVMPASRVKYSCELCSLRTGDKLSAILRSPAFVLCVLVFIGLMGLELMM